MQIYYYTMQLYLIPREFKGQNVATPAKYLRKWVDRLILVAQNLGLIP